MIAQTLVKSDKEGNTLRIIEGGDVRIHLVRKGKKPDRNIGHISETGDVKTYFKPLNPKNIMRETGRPEVGWNYDILKWLGQRDWLVFQNEKTLERYKCRVGDLKDESRRLPRKFEGFELQVFIPLAEFVNVREGGPPCESS